MLLDSASSDVRGRFTLICANPERTFSFTDIGRAPFDALRDVVATGGHRRDGPCWTGPGPFAGGAVGFLGYELGGALERLPPPRAPVFPASAAFGIYRTFAVFDVVDRQAWAVDIDGDRERARRLAGRLGGDRQHEESSAQSFSWTPDQTADDYYRRVSRIVDYIKAGDVFQANFAQRWTAPWPQSASAFDIYRRLRAQAPAPFCSFMTLDTANAFMSVSPERFVRVSPEGLVETRPIKGTRPRGATHEEDRRNAEALLTSAKDRAENLMIVDLMRNDLSRVCAHGSVRVPELCGIETFAAVHHLVSAVTGDLRPGLTAVDLLTACFPGGSITGAPKIRAMEIIAELEPAPRGPYCGTMFRLGFDGALDSSVLIRTLQKAGNLAVAHAGGGIVADSVPEDEYQESLTKARPLLAALAE